MAENEIITGKAAELTENTEPNNEDIFIFGNAGTSVLRKMKWSSILAAIKIRVAEWAFDTLSTTDKTIPGAIDELYGAQIKIATGQATGVNLTAETNVNVNIPITIPDGSEIYGGFAYLIGGYPAQSSINGISRENIAAVFRSESGATNRTVRGFAFYK